MCPKDTIKVSPVDIHHSDQHVGRADCIRATLAGEADSVLGDKPDRAMFLTLSGIGPLTSSAVGGRFERRLSDSQRLQCGPAFAMKA
jgi:hypothetical protein